MYSKKRHLSTDYKEVRNCLREPRHRADLFKVKHKNLSLCMSLFLLLIQTHKHRHTLKDVCKKWLLVETECKKTKKTVKKK